MIRWKRTTIEVDGSPRLVYLPNYEPEWEGWSIDRLPHPKSQRFFRYQPMKSGSAVGHTHSRLRDAKLCVEREGRGCDPVLTIGSGEVARFIVETEPFELASPYLHELPRREPKDVVVTGGVGDLADTGLLSRVRDGLRKL